MTVCTSAGLYQRCGLPPVGHAEEAADIEHGRVALVGGQQLRDPRVVADPVLDDHLGRRQGAGVLGGRLVAVGVGRRGW